MGFNVFHAITRAVGIPDKTAQTISNYLPITALAGANPYHYEQSISSLLGHHAAAPAPVNIQDRYPIVPQNTTQTTLPVYTGGYGYGGGGYYDAYNYTPSYDPYGGTPWVFSTPLQTYSSPQYQMSSAQPAGRTWEDLTTLALSSFL